jgi:hypothetical protein
VKLGRLRVQLDPDPFLGASQYNQTLDLETGEVLISVTSRRGDHTASLRIAPATAATPTATSFSAGQGQGQGQGQSGGGSVDAITVELLASSVPAHLSVRLELWRQDGPFPVFNSSSGGQGKPFSTFVTGDCLNASQKLMKADVVLKRSAQLLWYTRNEDSPVWRDTLERQLVLPAMPTGVRDPLLHRQFGALVQGVRPPRFTLALPRRPAPIPPPLPPRPPSLVCSIILRGSGWPGLADHVANSLLATLLRPAGGLWLAHAPDDGGGQPCQPGHHQPHQPDDFCGRVDQPDQRGG